ncbi:hypothetical protein J1N35_019478 [Gossypium stocksii]|uniref:Uncharacterized protein n=1 Tax=Gossypium stocksii TaxID=47602 RepID=A0A9D3VQZ0_9ROSI|nr:hypothetical protein J1N35_019478 [Gossypium stocksii]
MDDGQAGLSEKTLVSTLKKGAQAAAALALHCLHMDPEDRGEGEERWWGRES